MCIKQEHIGYKQIPFDILTAKEIIYGMTNGLLTTRDNKQVVVSYFNQDKTLYPIVGKIFDVDCDPIYETWDVNGKAITGKDTPNDLVLWVKKNHKTSKHKPIVAANEYQEQSNFCMFKQPDNKTKHGMNELLKELSNLKNLEHGTFGCVLTEHKLTILSPHNNRVYEVQKVSWRIDKAFGTEPIWIDIVGENIETGTKETFRYSNLSEKEKQQIRSTLFLEMLETDNSNL